MVKFPWEEVPSNHDLLCDQSMKGIEIENQGHP